MGSYYDIPKAIFLLVKGGFRARQVHHKTLMLFSHSDLKHHGILPCHDLGSLPRLREG